MLIQKTFHLPMARASAKANLTGLGAFRSHLVDVDLAAVTSDGLVHFEFQLPCGLQGSVYLAEIDGNNPFQSFFRSRGGNVEVLGLLEYFEIKPDLTEIVLTLEYTILPPVYRMIDYFIHGTDRFLNRQLEQVEAYFSREPIRGIRADRNLATPINGHAPHP